MEFERRKLEIWKSRLKSGLAKIFKSIRKDKKWLFQFAAVIFLLLISLLVYIKLSTKGSFQHNNTYKSKIINDAINQYRLENYPRAEIILKNVIEKGKNKNEVSIALLYLGNIMLKKNQFDKAISYYKGVYKNKELRKYAYYNSAIAEFKRGDISKALNDVKHALKYDQLFMEANLLLGNIYFLKGSYGKATEVYGRFQHNPVFLYNKAISYLFLKNYKSAEKILASLIARKDVEEVIKGLSFFELGNIYEGINTKKSSFYYYKAYSIFNQNDDLLYNTSIIMAKSGDFEKGKNLLINDNVENASDNEKTIYAYIFFKAGDLKRATNILTMMNEKGAEANIILGEISLKNGNIEDSINYFNKALEKANTDKQRFVAYKHLLEVYQKTGRLDKAIKICAGLNAKDKNNFIISLPCAEVYFEKKEDEKALSLLLAALESSNIDKERLYKLADIYFKYGYRNNALKVLYKIRDLYPDDNRALLGIAKIFLENGQKENAMDILNIIIERCKDVNVYYDSLIIKAQNINHENAEKIYKKLIEDFPYRYEAYYNLARLYLLDKRYEESNKLIESLLSENIKIPEDKKLYSYVIKGIALYKVGRKAEAYRAFLYASSIDSKNEIVRVNLGMIKMGNR